MNGRPAWFRSPVGPSAAQGARSSTPFEGEDLGGRKPAQLTAHCGRFKGCLPGEGIRSLAHAEIRALDFPAERPVRRTFLMYTLGGAPATVPERTFEFGWLDVNGSGIERLSAPNLHARGAHRTFVQRHVITGCEAEQRAQRGVLSAAQQFYYLHAESPC